MLRPNVLPHRHKGGFRAEVVSSDDDAVAVMHKKEGERERKRAKGERKTLVVAAAAPREAPWVRWSARSPGKQSSNLWKNKFRLMRQRQRENMGF